MAVKQVLISQDIGRGKELEKARGKQKGVKPGGTLASAGKMQIMDLGSEGSKLDPTQALERLPSRKISRASIEITCHKGGNTGKCCTLVGPGK